MSDYNKVLGKVGENISCNFLVNKGYKIIEKNYKCNYGEIDIIAMDGNEIVFVEVKTRTNKLYGIPAEAVTRNKQKHIMNTANFYIMRNNLKDINVRFDVIEVLKKNKYYIRHLKKCSFYNN